MTMKKLFILIACVLLGATAAQAKVKTVGRGETLNFDAKSIPPRFFEAYGVMKAKCSTCHTMERTVVAITSGVAPITGQLFDKQATKAYAIKMMRKPKSGMSRDEIKLVYQLMNYLIDEQNK
jgi:uncharacterized membrane protein